MKLKVISLVGVISSIALFPGSSFAQKAIKLVMEQEDFILLNQEVAKKFNLDLERVKSVLDVQNDDEIIVSLDEIDDIINLDIYNNKEFSNSRVDRDGVSY